MLFHMLYFAQGFFYKGSWVPQSNEFWQINFFFLLQYSVFLMILTNDKEKLTMIPDIFTKCKASDMRMVVTFI